MIEAPRMPTAFVANIAIPDFIAGIEPSANPMPAVQSGGRSETEIAMPATVGAHSFFTHARLAIAPEQSATRRYTRGWIEEGTSVGAPMTCENVHVSPAARANVSATEIARMVSACRAPRKLRDTAETASRRIGVSTGATTMPPMTIGGFSTRMPDVTMTTESMSSR